MSFFYFYVWKVFINFVKLMFDSFLMFFKEEMVVLNFVGMVISIFWINLELGNLDLSNFILFVILSNLLKYFFIVLEFFIFWSLNFLISFNIFMFLIFLFFLYFFFKKFEILKFDFIVIILSKIVDEVMMNNVVFIFDLFDFFLLWFLIYFMISLVGNEGIL